MTKFGNDYTDAWNSKKPENVASFFAIDGSLTVNNGTPMVGREAITEFASSFMTAFPDMKLTKENLLIKADETQYHWSFVGTNTGLNGTGNKVEFKGFERWVFNEEGLIKSSTGKFDEEDYNRTIEQVTEKQEKKNNMNEEGMEKIEQANGTSDTKSIRPAKFAHVVYRTRRFEQMLEWYQTVFDADIQFQNEALAFLTYDEEHHRFAFANMSVFQPNEEETSNPNEVGVDHVAYTYASLNDLLETFARLKGNEINPYWCIHHGMTVSLYYADPDGNQLEFQVDSYKTVEETNAFLNEHFSANPLGVEFDPEDWLTKLQNGESESDFLIRRVHEPVSPLRGRITEFV